MDSELVANDWKLVNGTLRLERLKSSQRTCLHKAARSTLTFRRPAVKAGQQRCRTCKGYQWGHSRWRSTSTSRSTSPIISISPNTTSITNSSTRHHRLGVLSHRPCGKSLWRACTKAASSAAGTMTTIRGRSGLARHTARVRGKDASPPRCVQCDLRISLAHQRWVEPRARTISGWGDPQCDWTRLFVTLADFMFFGLWRTMSSAAFSMRGYVLVGFFAKTGTMIYV